MGKPHKHSELIKLWADGAEIEFAYGNTDEWTPKNHSEWWEDYKYRIKPEPKPDVVGWMNAEPIDGGLFLTGIKHQNSNLKLTFDSETGELKSAEVLK